MFAAVFQAEMLRSTRHLAAYVLRWILAAWLVLLVAFFFQTDDKARFSTNARQFVNFLLVQQFILFALATPAFAAGAITDEKTRGTLDPLLATHLGPLAIVGGKLAARAGQVGLLGLVSLPIIAFFGPYGGVPPEFIVALVVTSACLLLSLSAISLLASVWTKQTRTAVLVVYILVGGAWLLFALDLLPLPQELIDALNPLHALETAFDRDDPAEVARRLGRTATVYGTITLVCWLVASWRLRPAHVKQLQAKPRRRLAFRNLDRPRPTLDAIAWKEGHVGRRLPRWLTLPLCFAVGLAWAIAAAGPGFRTEEAMHLVFIAALIASAAVGVRASGTIVGERERQTWEGLLTTPWTFRDLVRGKLRGILASTWPFVLAFDLGVAVVVGPMSRSEPVAFVAYAAVAAAVASGIGWYLPKAGPWAAGVLAILWAAAGGVEYALAVTAGLLVTWLMMDFLGSVGMWCSARSQSSWRSLLATVTLGYLGGFVLWCVASPLTCVAMSIFAILSWALESLARSSGAAGVLTVPWAGVLTVLVWAGAVGLAYWWVARTMLVGAEQSLERAERIPSGYMRYISMDLPFRRRKA